MPDPFTITQTGIDPAVPLATFDNFGNLILAGNVYADGLPAITTPGAPALTGGSSAAGVVVPVAAPTGQAARDTPTVQAAIAKLTSALNYGPATLQFQDGTYVLDGSSAVIQSVSNFRVTSSGGAVLALAPNRAAKPNNTTGDIFVIADSNDFTVSNITFDGQRDQYSPVTPVTAAITGGQPSLTIAAGAAAGVFFPGLVVSLQGGYGSGESGQSQGGRTVKSVTPGGGSGGGDLITFTSNITATYNDVNGTLINDAYGPYACTGAFLWFYEVAVNNTTAGRVVTSEDQQNGLHLMNCTNFTITGNTARNVWESPIKIGCGVGVQASRYTNSCYNGTVSNNQCYHAYDQGVSVWISQYVVVSSNYIDSSGWAGISFTESDNCIASANTIKNTIYELSGQAGGGVAVEGGVSNVIDGNIITAPVNATVAGGISIQGYPSNGVWGLTTTNTNWPTSTNFLEQGTAGGTSIVISSTSLMQVGGRYSILDGYRTEALTCASIIDSTHATFTESTRFSHAAGLYIQPRISQDNIVSNNTIDMLGAFDAGTNGISGIANRGSVRSCIKGNVFKNYTNNGIDLNSSNVFCAPNSYLCGDGAQVIGNTFGGGTNGPISCSGVTHLLINGNRIYGTPTSGANRGIYLAGVTDSIVTGNWIEGGTGSDCIRLATGGSVSVACSHVIVSNNVCRSSNGNGINAIAVDSCHFIGNTCGSNVSWGVSVSGSTNCLVEGNVCNSNHSGGITLSNNGSTGSTNCRVIGNTCREDGTGVNVTSGATFTSPQGIVEGTDGDTNLFMGNECDSNTSAQLTVVGAGSVSHYNIISGVIGS
jgi:parallel beta-helix repeat protein